MKRVVVTGMGLVTPLGCGTEINWKNLISGVSGAKNISKFDVSNYKCQVACEVPLDKDLEGSFIEEQWIDKKELKKENSKIKVERNKAVRQLESFKKKISKLIEP